MRSTREGHRGPLLPAPPGRSRTRTACTKPHRRYPAAARQRRMAAEGKTEDRRHAPEPERCAGIDHVLELSRQQRDVLPQIVDDIDRARGQSQSYSGTQNLPFADGSAAPTPSSSWSPAAVAADLDGVQNQTAAAPGVPLSLRFTTAAFPSEPSACRGFPHQLFRGLPMMASTVPHAPARYVNVRCLTGRHEQSVVEAIADTVAILACFPCDVEWTLPATHPALRALTV